ncbi:putative Outer mnembrane protein OmpA [Gammaproteobacteria bacterium]
MRITQAARGVYLYAVAVLFIMMNQAGAEEVRLYKTPPSADDVRQALFPEIKPTDDAVIRTSPKRKTRSIQIPPSAEDSRPVDKRGFKRDQSSINTSSSTDTHQQVVSDSPSSTPTVMAVQIQFNYKSDEIGPEQTAFLDPVGQGMVSDTTGTSKLIIEGHTDAAGSPIYNRDLSLRRANAAKQYLVDKYGIAPDRLITVGKGAKELLVKDDPLDGRNRRIQFRRQ